MLQQRSTDGLGPGATPFQRALTPVLASLSAIAFYNVLEIWIQIFSIFKRLWTGLYFWSLLAVTWGIVIVECGNLTKYQVPGMNWIGYCMLTMIGFVLMVVGQSLVLYSRLHLVVHSRKVLRNILIMILVGSTAVLVPSQISAFGENSPNSAYWIPIFSVTERLQLCWFAVQETIISVTYIWATVKMVRVSMSVQKRRVLQFLVWVNVIIIFLDAIPVILQFFNWANVQGFVKTVVYSIKVKLEFAMLGQLMSITRTSVAPSNTHEGIIATKTSESTDQHSQIMSQPSHHDIAAHGDDPSSNGRAMSVQSDTSKRDTSHPRSNARIGTSKAEDDLSGLGDAFASSMFGTLLGTVAGQGAVKPRSNSVSLASGTPQSGIPMSTITSRNNSIAETSTGPSGKAASDSPLPRQTQSGPSETSSPREHARITSPARHNLETLQEERASNLALSNVNDKGSATSAPHKSPPSAIPSPSSGPYVPTAIHPDFGEANQQGDVEQADTSRENIDDLGQLFLRRRGSVKEFDTRGSHAEVAPDDYEYERMRSGRKKKWFRLG